MAACLAAVCGWAWGLVALGLALGLIHNVTVTKPIPIDFWLRKFFAEEVLMYSGLAVAAAWLCLALGGRWRRSADALDLLVGVCWILVGLVWTGREYAEFL
jgi:hypothetical protein